MNKPASPPPNRTPGRLIEGVEVSPASGWTRRCQGCTWQASDPRKWRVDRAAAAHMDATGHHCPGGWYGRIRDDHALEG